MPITQHASLALVVTKNQTSYCSGMLVDSSRVLTAAHCFDGTSKASRFDVLIRSGTYKIKSIVVNPSYNKKASTEAKAPYDLAMVTLDRPADLFPVAIASGAEVKIGDIYSAYGYGRTESNKLNRNLYNRSRTAQLTIADINDTRDLLLTVQSTSNASLCPGDSGGGLIWHDGNGRRLLMGIGILSTNKIKNGKCVLGGKGEARGSSIFINLQSEPAKQFLSMFPDLPLFNTPQNSYCWVEGIGYRIGTRCFDTPIAGGL